MTENPEKVLAALGGAVCEVCEKPLNPNGPGVFRRVVGWVENRKAGGAHAIRLQTDLGVYRHHDCMLFGSAETLFDGS